MKSFLCRNKRPVVKWGMLPDNTFYEGSTPEGFSLAVCPSEEHVIVDVDRHGKIDGFDSIPSHLTRELSETLNYETKNNGKHYWFRYTGNNTLANKASNQGIDLRTNKGYVVYYPDNDIRKQMHLVNESSPELNTWLEELFGFKKY